MDINLLEKQRPFAELDFYETKFNIDAVTWLPENKLLEIEEQMSNNFNISSAGDKFVSLLKDINTVPTADVPTELVKEYLLNGKDFYFKDMSGNAFWDVIPTTKMDYVDGHFDTNAFSVKPSTYQPPDHDLNYHQMTGFFAESWVNDGANSAKIQKPASCNNCIGSKQQLDLVLDIHANNNNTSDIKVFENTANNSNIKPEILKGGPILRDINGNCVSGLECGTIDDLNLENKFTTKRIGSSKGEIYLSVKGGEDEYIDVIHTIHECEAKPNTVPHPKKRGRKKLVYDYKCDLCSKDFKSSNNLKFHQRTHTGYRPYNCLHCEEKFKQPSHLKSHTRRHTGERPYKCTVCNATFIQGTTLKIHLIRKHSNVRDKGTVSKVKCVVKNFYCKFCDKTYIGEVYKREHMKIHAEKEIFSCEVCEKAFKKKASYENHATIHSSNYEDRKFEKEATKNPKSNEGNRKNSTKLKSIGMKFAQTDDKNYNCKYCSRPFKSIANLKVHCRTHTGEKPYKCEMCQTSFRQISHLKDHFSRHTGNRPYSCFLCKCVFSRRSTASNHVKVMHGKDKRFVRRNLAEDKENGVN